MMETTKCKKTLKIIGVVTLGILAFPFAVISSTCFISHKFFSSVSFLIIGKIKAAREELNEIKISNII